MADSKQQPTSGYSVVVSSVSNSNNAISKHHSSDSTDVASLSSQTSSVKHVGFWAMLRYADKTDIWLMIVGCIAAAASGACWPGFSIAFGEVLNAFSAADPKKEVNKYVLIMLYIAIASFVAGILEVSCFKLFGGCQATRVKQLYLQSLLYQDMPFFDLQSAHGKLMKGLNEDITAYQDAISERMGAFIHNLAVFAVGLGIAFWKGWALTLIILAAIPCLVIVSALIAIINGRLHAKSTAAYASAGAVAQEALSNVRTVTAFCAEDAVVARYDAGLEQPLKWGKLQGLLGGLALGTTHFVFFASYALALWFGSRKVADGDYNGGKVINVILSAVLAGFALGQAMPHLEHFQRGKMAARDLFSLISRRPKIQVDAEGTILATCRGDIELDNVNFAYPTTPSRMVLDGFNLTIPAGTTMALVGESGSGKSTVVQLIQRFYDPQSGGVFLDGHSLRNLQLRWLRGQIGMVRQEPVLFATTILENIAHGKPGATKEEVIQAAMLANAHVFINKLPDGYNTHVGEKGTQMSGGQKQRIAIARAILRNPRILLLDEATSALDVQSEKAVQHALNSLMVGRTTVVVAHRLSTIQNADTIAVVRHGKVVEEGTHAELAAKEGGRYATMWAMQQVKHAQENDESEETVEHARTGQMPESLLKRGSVRLSIIPASIQEKLAKRKAGGGAAGGSSSKSAVRKLWDLNRPEWRFGAVGLFTSALLGLAMPAYALALGSILADFYQTDPEDIRDSGHKWGIVFSCIGVGCLLLEPVQGWCFGVMGQQLARRLRVTMFRDMLRQEAGWFDAEENASGILSSRLSNDAAVVRGAVGDRFGLLVQNLACALAAYIIAFVSSWSVTLVVTAALPLLALAQVIQAKVYFNMGDSSSSANDAANKVATEAMSAIQTVTAFGLQDKVSRIYVATSGETNSKRSAAAAGFGFGFSQFVLYGIFCLAFWFGGQEVQNGNISFMDLLRAFLAIFYCAFGMAQAQSAFPDIGKAGAAIERIFKIIDKRPEIDGSETVGAKLPMAMVQGSVKFENVTFAYPNRPGRLVLKHFNLTVATGTSLALVGESGSGKSTIVALLERFYDPIEGAVMLDGVDLRKLNLKWLRSQIGLVNQEPVLFTATLLENIKYGNENATMDQVVEAAKAAHALDFIDKLPEKFDTKVGEGGIQLSGGQKQRIAIARAVLKDPKVLLLDEATSALDAESERIVQEALDEIMVNRTTIIVAHRLSTIRTADKIAVVHRGRVLEQGSHDDLASSKSYYYYMLSSMRTT